jgi:hypothetical protein
VVAPSVVSASSVTKPSPSPRTTRRKQPLQQTPAPTATRRSSVASEVHSPSHIIRLHRTGSFEVERVSDGEEVAPEEDTDRDAAPVTQTQRPFQSQALFQSAARNRRMSYGGPEGIRTISAGGQAATFYPQSAPPAVRRWDPFEMEGTHEPLVGQDEIHSLGRTLKGVCAIVESGNIESEEAASATLARARAALEYGKTEAGTGESAELLALCHRVASVCLSTAEGLARAEEIRRREYEQRLIAVQTALQSASREAVKREKEIARLEQASRDAAMAAERQGMQDELDRLRRDLASAKAECDSSQLRARAAAVEAEERLREALAVQAEEMQSASAADVDRMRAAVNQLREAAMSERAQVEMDVRESCAAQVRMWQARAAAAEERADAAEVAGAQAEATALRSGAEEREHMRESFAVELRAAKQLAAEAEAAAAAQIAAVRQEEKDRALEKIRTAEARVEEVEREREKDLREMRITLEQRVSDERMKSSTEAASTMRQMRAAHNAAMSKAGNEVLDLQRKLRRLQAYNDART